MREPKEYLQLGKRLNFLIRELEVEALDLAAYAKPLAEGKMKNHQVEQLTARMNKWSTELLRIESAVNKLLEEDYNGDDARRTESSGKRKS